MVDDRIVGESGFGAPLSSVGEGERAGERNEKSEMPKSLPKDDMREEDHSPSSLPDKVRRGGDSGARETGEFGESMPELFASVGEDNDSRSFSDESSENAECSSLEGGGWT